MVLGLFAAAAAVIALAGTALTHRADLLADRSGLGEALQRAGPGGIGWEGWLIVALFLAGYTVLYLIS